MTTIYNNIKINYFKCLDFILISLLYSFIDSFKLATINFILAYGQNVYGITLIQTLMFSKNISNNGPRLCRLNHYIMNLNKILLFKKQALLLSLFNNLSL